jgi:hypothetical protein
MTGNATAPDRHEHTLATPFPFDSPNSAHAARDPK